MKKTLLTTVLADLASFQLIAGGANWMTDLPKPQAKAQAEKKLVLMDFTGSDWCGWCIKLDKEVFSTKEFAAYADKNLVLMEVDFPRSKKQSPEVKKANQELAKKYNIRGYPTIIVLNSSGKQVGELGYMKGGPKAFIAELERIRKKS